ncbi:hypothetical protein ANN_07722 [Periplaneta americana]|uniref:Uncharacterized protein n=1 Tax=Periplaneta americana TaxID=6978 RepID=A0ABQ8T0X7_PERAM|nr:hypothetical protein ANN_07722 [Periplaneta americana]
MAGMNGHSHKEKLCHFGREKRRRERNVLEYLTGGGAAYRQAPSHETHSSAAGLGHSTPQFVGVQRKHSQLVKMQLQCTELTISGNPTVPDR